MRYCFYFILLLNFHAHSQVRKLYDLKPGEFAVGFKTITTYDLSRSPVFTSDIQGKLGKLQNSNGRQIRISLWYPAVKNSSQMKWRDYLTALGEANGPTASAFKQGVSMYLESINGFRNTPVDEKKLETLYNLSMNAYKNASHQKGNFPVLLFPSYESPSTITILSEFVASHGYIVASTELLGTESVLPEISPQGIQTMTLDLLFATNYLRSKPYADITRLAAIGVGINATAAFSLKAVTPEVDALISLEGGILAVNEIQFLKKSVFYDANKFNTPSLFIYAPHPSILPQTVDELKYGDKYFIHFPKMSEYYFLDYGVLEQYIPGIIGIPPGDTKKGFELAATCVLQFLNMTLKNDKKDGLLLMSKTDPLYDSLYVTKKYIPALTAIPSLVQIKNLIMTKSITAFQDIYQEAKTNNNQVFSQQFLTDIINWLAYKRDPDFSKRKIVAEIRIELYPGSSRAYFSLGNINFQLHNNEQAKKNYNEVLRLLSSDTDIDLTAAIKERIKKVSEENLKKL